MTWFDKVGRIEGLECFLCDWRSREELINKFGLTNTESWHAVQWFKAMKSKFVIQERMGITKRMILIKIR